MTVRFLSELKVGKAKKNTVKNNKNYNKSSSWSEQRRNSPISPDSKTVRKTAHRMDAIEFRFSPSTIALNPFFVFYWEDRLTGWTQVVKHALILTPSSFSADFWEKVSVSHTKNHKLTSFLQGYPNWHICDRSWALTCISLPAVSVFFFLKCLVWW